jgi:hypothetical protein
MNLLRIVRWIVQPHSKALLPDRSWPVAISSLRWQSTDAPSKEKPSAEVSTKVTPVQQSNLMEFFETTDKLYDTKIIHGELNKESFADARLTPEQDVGGKWTNCASKATKIFTNYGETTVD